MSDQTSTQKVMSPGGSDRDDGNGDDRRHFKFTHERSTDLDWIILLVLLLLILCFCLPPPQDQLEDHSAHFWSRSQPTCSGQHRSCSELSLLQSETSTIDDGSVALFRGGYMSKVSTTLTTKSDNEGGGATSSASFPRGNSHNPQVSEEESHHVHVRDEMACIKYRQRRIKQREPFLMQATPPRPHSPIDEHVHVLEPTLDSAPKSFTSPSPETMHIDGPLQEPLNNGDVGEHPIFHSQSVFRSPPKPASSVCTFLTDASICRAQHKTLCYLLNSDTVRATANESGGEELEQNRDEVDDVPAVFRGPGVPQKMKTIANSLDSGMGTSSTPNQIPVTGGLPTATAVTTVDISWWTSFKEGELVYQTPHPDNVQASFQHVYPLSSIEEQTPRSPNHQEEFVGVKKLNLEGRFVNPCHDTPTPGAQPSLFESPDENTCTYVLEPTLKVFSYPSPELNCNIDIPDEQPRDAHVFVSSAGTTFVSHTSSSFINSCSYLTDTTIARSQQFQLRYFIAGPIQMPN